MNNLQPINDVSYERHRFSNLEYGNLISIITIINTLKSTNKNNFVITFLYFDLFIDKFYKDVSHIT